MTERVATLPRLSDARGPSLAALRERLAAAPTWVYLTVIVIASGATRFALALTAVAPWIHPDEFIYSELARSVAEGSGFGVRGEPFSPWSYGPLYPVVIAPAYLLADSVPDAYLIVKAINAGLWSVTAVPLYFLARRALDRNAALATAALGLLLPSGVYTAKYMTESLAYPAFAVAALAMVRALERPSSAREAAALCAIAVAVAVRAQMVALLPAFALATVLVSLGDGNGLRGALRMGRLTLGAAFVASSIFAAQAAGMGRGVLGLRVGLFDDVVLADVPRQLVYHVGELSLYVGVLPLVAFVMTMGPALVTRTVAREARVFAAVAVATSACVLALVATYATSPKPFPRIYDRYTFYVAALLLVGLVTWARAGLPRPRRWAVPAVALATFLPALLPYRGLLNGAEWGVSSSTVALVPWGVVRHFTGTGASLVALILGFTLVLAYVGTVASRTRSWIVVRVTTYTLVALTAIACLANAKVSRNAERLGVAADPAWIDAAVPRGSEVVAIWSGRFARGWEGWFSIWENEFFNRRVGRVYSLREPIPDFAREPRASLRGDTLWAHGRPLEARYVLTDASVSVRGEAVAADAGTSMTLYRVNGSIRLWGRP